MMEIKINVTIFSSSAKKNSGLRDWKVMLSNLSKFKMSNLEKHVDRQHIMRLKLISWGRIVTNRTTVKEWTNKTERLGKKR